MLRRLISSIAGHPPGIPIIVTVAVWTVCAAAVGLAVVLNKSAGPAGLLVSRSLGAAALLLLAMLVFAGALLRAAALSSRETRATFRRSLWMNAAMIVVVILTAETALRLLAVPTPLGERIGELELLPHDWEQVRRTNRALLERVRSPDAVFNVEDELLGWNVGGSRESADGLYRTSSEGIRSAKAGVRLAERPFRWRVALIGDSFTFGEEVPFEQTWGHYLEVGLGPDVQVLNFGVPSHGMDQTLLKYGRDVRGWNADVTVLSFLGGNPLRNTNVYLFLRPGQDLPFSKPRFVLRDGRLEVVNAPSVPAEVIIAAGGIHDLPWINLDSEFIRERWQRGPLDVSYVARYLFSRFPRWPEPGTRPTDSELVELTSALVERIVLDVCAAGSVPILVALPVHADLSGNPTRLKAALVRAVYARTGVEVLDVGSCMLERVPLKELFMPQDPEALARGHAPLAHYTPRGNAALAECLRPAVSAALAAARVADSPAPSEEAACAVRVLR
mgnify:CR=1 FL=1